VGARCAEEGARWDMSAAYRMGYAYILVHIGLCVLFESERS